MVTPLQDLQNRINSNTLTVAQQAALSTSLGAIIAAGFETPDERTTVESDELNAREWYAALYAINAEGTSGGTAVLPTNQTVWHINAVTGNNANNGLTSGTAIQSAAYLASLWRGTAGGGRPQLIPSVGTTITVFLDSDLPSTDPLAVLLDVDMPQGTSLIIQGAAKAPTRTGNMTAASAFAQTSAGGQQTFTDAGVANFAPLVGAASLIQDSTTGGVGWLYAPLSGVSATATCTRLYSAQTAGVVAGMTTADPAAGNAYTASDVTNATLGQDWRTRDFPDDGQSTLSVGAVVFFYRLHLKDPNANAIAQIQDSPSAEFVFQECIIDSMSVEAQNSTNISLLNSLVFKASIFATSAAIIEALAGGVQGATNGGVTATNGGTFIGDQDFVCVSDTTGARYTAGSGSLTLQGGTLILGAVGAYHNTAAGGPMLATSGAGSSIEVLPFVTAASVVYGTDSANFAAIGGNNCQCRYTSTSVAHFKSTNSAFTVGKALASSFGFDQTAGAYVGPTTCTQAHQDAALGAGTGFGGVVTDPASGCIFAAL